MRVLWITNIPSPYRLKFFAELGKNVDLTVIFEKGFSSERDETWKDFSFGNYSGVVLKGLSVSTDMSLSFGYKRYIRAFENDVIVVSNPVTPTGISAIFFMQSHKIKYIIESDGAFPKERVGLRGLIKAKLYSRAAFCLTTSDLGKQYFLNYGVKEERIEKYPFSSVSACEIVDASDVIVKKKKCKKKLGIREERMILAVGQFIARKGFEDLLLATKQFETNVGIYIIGGIAGEKYLSLLSEADKERVHFYPFMSPNKLREYYLAADVFAFPTHEDIWGLVVNEALSQATPVVTTNKCISGLEMIRNGKNGYIIGDSDISQLSNRINEILNTDSFEDLCKGAINTAKEYTIEKMVDKHVEFFMTFCSLS